MSRTIGQRIGGLRQGKWPRQISYYRLRPARVQVPAFRPAARRRGRRDNGLDVPVRPPVLSR
ncbi:MAG TPA: hypothetical protein VIL46_04760, partial [Gemmataceae bacterium]